ncbi:methyl-accepting chemotaxis protein [Pseudomonas sp. A-1]|nr:MULTISPECIES: methyl-accepting chemotaxis protein [unclassified Pseudomonas]THG86437.1 methyl-accepting chemotaxis protein [Pseudomonas sp. A-1]WPP46272.1 methyl-accepting chemotaxis protein [Pseudomonas sp. AN-1]
MFSHASSKLLSTAIARHLIKLIGGFSGMEWFGRQKTGIKLICGFLMVSLFGALIGLQGILKAAQMSDLATTMYRQETVGIRHAAVTQIQFLAATRALRNAMLASSPVEHELAKVDLRERLQLAYAELAEAKKAFVTPQGQLDADEARKALVEYEQVAAEVVRRLETDDPDSKRNAIDYAFSEGRPAVAHADELLGRLIERKMANAARIAKETEEIYASNRLLLVILTILGMLGSILIGVFLTRSLTRQLGGEPSEVAAMATRIAAGDLSVRIDTSKAASGSVVQAMGRMQESLTRVVGAVRASSDSIATGSAQIASGNIDLSSRTEQQAASLEETAASMEELTSTVRQNADNARQASTLACDASSTADLGRAVVLQVVDTMQGINESSQRISSIINVIDSIAFQTNILALNASVEAARAGEQGRGFAVVASEVRSLASRSADAAHEIRGLIGESTRRVEDGALLVERAGKTMADVVAAARRVTDIIDEISAASQEQSDGIAQVNSAVAQMDQVTQQNAALVQEASAASASLAEQAQKLQEAVAVFRLGEAATAFVPFQRAAVVPVANSQFEREKQPAAGGDWEAF